MSNEEPWEHFFKSEIKAAGRKLVAEEKVTVTSVTDTYVQGYVRATPPVRVALSSDGIASARFSASCTCPTAKKSQFCKHVWAVIVLVREDYPDFLSGKTSIEKALAADGGAPEAPESSFRETAKERAADYRREQYAKQKARLKDQKREAKARAGVVPQAYPSEVEAALAYFDQNGFPMPEGPDEAVVAMAKKKLSRVFHPDKGGAHEESVELYRNCEVLMEYLRGA